MFLLKYVTITTVTNATVTSVTITTVKISLTIFLLKKCFCERNKLLTTKNLGQIYVTTKKNVKKTGEKKFMKKKRKIVTTVTTVTTLTTVTTVTTVTSVATVTTVTTAT